MKISVIIPTYRKHHNFLAQAVSSIDFHPLEECEIIVVNDEIDPEFQLSDAINRTTEKRWGAGEARNQGVKHATGECIVFLDSDDYALPTALNWLWAKYEEIKDKANEKHIIYGDVLRTDALKVHVMREPYYGSNFNMSPLNPEMNFCPPFCLIPKEYHDAVGGQLPEDVVDTWEDIIYYSDLWAIGVPFTKIDKITYVYRWAFNGRRSISEDEEIRSAVKSFIYNRYRKYFEGEEMPAGCRTCGGNTPMPVKKQQLSGRARVLPKVESFEELYLEYTAPQQARTYKGPATGLEYRFGKGHNHKAKKVVDKLPEQIDRHKEVHIEDARVLYTYRRRGYDDFATAIIIRAEVIDPHSQPIEPEPPIQPPKRRSKPKAKPIPTEEYELDEKSKPDFPEVISEYTVAQMEERLMYAVANFQVEVWVIDENAQEKPRASMIKLLEGYLAKK